MKSLNSEVGCQMKVRLYRADSNKLHRQGLQKAGVDPERSAVLHANGWRKIFWSKETRERGKQQFLVRFIDLQNPIWTNKIRKLVLGTGTGCGFQNILELGLEIKGQNEGKGWRGARINDSSASIRSNRETKWVMIQWRKFQTKCSQEMVWGETLSNIPDYERTSIFSGKSGAHNRLLRADLIQILRRRTFHWLRMPLSCWLKTKISNRYYGNTQRKNTQVVEVKKCNSGA